MLINKSLFTSARREHFSKPSPLSLLLSSGQIMNSDISPTEYNSNPIRTITPD